jgi:hypothetical protein
MYSVGQGSDVHDSFWELNQFFQFLYYNQHSIPKEYIPQGYQVPTLEGLDKLDRYL